MVTVHVKGEEEDDQFLFECSCASTIDQIADSIFKIHTLQSTIHRLSPRLREHFPQAPPSFLRVLSEAEAYASKDQVEYKRPLVINVLRDHVKCIEKEVKGLQAVETTGDDTPLCIEISDAKAHNRQQAQLWWAGKQLLDGKKLSDYIGINEKTKIVVRIKQESLCKP